MNLRDKVNSDLKEAMKAKDKIRLETIRSIRAQILEYEKSGKDKELSPEDEINILSSASKKRKESIEQFSKAGRTDLADKEEKELEIIQSYLPKQLSPEEIFNSVKEIAKEIDAKNKKDFAKLMPAAIKKLKGQADGNIIRNEIERFLSSN